MLCISVDMFTMVHGGLIHIINSVYEHIRIVSYCKHVCLFCFSCNTRKIVFMYLAAFRNWYLTVKSIVRVHVTTTPIYIAFVLYSKWFTHFYGLTLLFLIFFARTSPLSLASAIKYTTIYILILSLYTVLMIFMSQIIFYILCYMFKKA